MRKLLITFLLVIASQSFSAESYFDDGHELKELLSRCWSDGFIHRMCGRANGYISGVLDTISDSNRLTKCLPAEQLSKNDIMLVVHGWLISHPNRMDENAADLVIEAVNEAWPCS